MIGVSNPLPPLCDCGNDLAPEASECRACRGDREAIEATDRADEFQARSHEWFASLSPVTLEQKAASHEEASYYADSAATFNERWVAQYCEGK